MRGSVFSSIFNSSLVWGSCTLPFQSYKTKYIQTLCQEWKQYEDLDLNTKTVSVRVARASQQTARIVAP
jgi:hypothetical protein